MVRSSVASDHHPTRTEASVVLCVEVPENALVSDGDQIDDNDNDEDTTVPSGSAWQVDSIEVCEAATVEPPKVHCQDQDYDYDNNDDSVSPSYKDDMARMMTLSHHPPLPLVVEQSPDQRS